MAASDLLVVPSVWPEPFGSVGPAAAQHGIPAAAFAVGGIPQWLHEGVNGHLADGNTRRLHRRSRRRSSRACRIRSITPRYAVVRATSAQPSLWNAICPS